MTAFLAGEAAYGLATVSPVGDAVAYVHP